MNGTENRIRRALQELENEVLISEHDVLAAQRRFAQLTAERVHRRGRVVAIAAAAVTVGAIAGGTLVWSLNEPAETLAPAGPAPDERSVDAAGNLPTAQDLVGLWAMPYNNGWVWEFHQDGSWGWTNPGDPSAYEESFYQVDEGVLDTTLCTFLVRWEGSGTMVGTATQDAGDRPGCHWTVGEEQTWIRMSPSGPASDTMFKDRALRTTGSPSIGSLTGAWWQQESGRVLLVTQAEGVLAYRLDDDGDALTAPDDAGTAVLDDRGDLTLTSEHGCPSGFSVTLTDLTEGTSQREGSSRLRFMKAASAPGTCPVHADLEGTWLKVP